MNAARVNWNALIGETVGFRSGPVKWASNAPISKPDRAYLKKVGKMRSGRMLRHERNFVWVQPADDWRLQIRVRKKDIKLADRLRKAEKRK